MSSEQVVPALFSPVCDTFNGVGSVLSEVLLSLFDALLCFISQVVSGVLHLVTSIFKVALHILDDVLSLFSETTVSMMRDRDVEVVRLLELGINLVAFVRMRLVLVVQRMVVDEGLMAAGRRHVDSSVLWPDSDNTWSYYLVILVLDLFKLVLVLLVQFVLQLITLIGFLLLHVVLNPMHTLVYLMVKVVSSLSHLLAHIVQGVLDGSTDA